MKVHKRDAQALRRGISEWRETGLIDEGTANALRGSIVVLPFDFKRLAKYSFWIAVVCILIALSAAMADKYLAALIKQLFDATHLTKFAGLCVLSAALYWTGIWMRARNPERVYSSEAVLFFGVLATGGMIAELGLALDTGSGRYSLLILLACAVYGALGYIFNSNLIWLFFLLSLGAWLGAETGYMSGWGAYYLGMNYPVRFALFGGVLTGAALALENVHFIRSLFKTTLVMGLLYLFIALWIMSIFGNYGDMHAWEKAKQIELFHWSILFAAVACAAIWHGLRHDSGVTKGFGLTFLFINLYTRYFEFFWNATHKAVFFAILAVSFWAIGRKAEKIWNLGSGPPYSTR